MWAATPRQSRVGVEVECRPVYRSRAVLSCTQHTCATGRDSARRQYLASPEHVALGFGTSAQKTRLLAVAVSHADEIIRGRRTPTIGPPARVKAGHQS